MMKSAADDWELLDQYARMRSQDAFARLAARHADKVFNTALRRTRNPLLAEEVTQAVFIVLARTASRLHQTGSLGAWLHKTALHAAANAVRAESRRRKYERAASRGELIPPLSDDESAQTACAVEDELHRLPARDQQVLAFHYLEGQTMAETARQIGISIEAARKRLTRALEKLRTRLRRRGIVASAGAIAGAIGGISEAPAHAATGSIGSLATAGGENGNAFSLASELIHGMRLLMLKKAAAIIVIVGIFVTGIGIAAAQIGRDSQGAPPSAAGTQPVKLQLPDAIRAALARNAADLNPSITVEWSTRPSSQLPVLQLAEAVGLNDGRTGAPDPKAAEEFLKDRMLWRATWQQGKYFGTSGNEPREGNSRLSIAEYSFDGDYVYVGFKRPPSAPTLFKRALAQDRNASGGSRSGDQELSSEYFTMIGLPLPARIGELRAHQPPTPELLALLERGGTLSAVEQSKIDDHPVIRIQITADNPDRRAAINTDLDRLADFLRRSGPAWQVPVMVERVKQRRQLPEKRIYVYYLDPEFSYGLRRSEQLYDGGILLTRVDCGDFQKVPGRQLYLPHRCVNDDYAGVIPGKYSKVPVFTTTYDVSAVSVDPLPAEAFTPNYTEAGTQIIEDLLEGRQKRSIVQEDGSIQEQVPQRRPATSPAGNR